MVLTLEQTTPVVEQAIAWPDRARALTILDGPTYTQAGELLLGIKDLRREINDTFDPIIADAYKAHRTACDKKKGAEAPLVEAEGILKRGMVAYDTEQERQRQEAQRRLEEQTRRQDDERRLEEAAALEREGLATDRPELILEAEDLLAAPVQSAPVFVPSHTPKVAGIVYRETWSAQVVSKLALIQFVAIHPEYVDLLDASMPNLNRLAKSLKDKLKIGGVRAVATKDVAAGRR